MTIADRTNPGVLDYSFTGPCERSLDDMLIRILHEMSQRAREGNVAELSLPEPLRTLAE